MYTLASKATPTCFNGKPTSYLWYILKINGQMSGYAGEGKTATEAKKDALRIIKDLEDAELCQNLTLNS